MASGIYSEDNSMMATLTMPPNAEISVIHDRVPIFIEEADWTRYLDPELLNDEEKRRMISTPPDGIFEYWPVDTKACGADLKKPLVVTQPGQPDLFGET